MSPLDLPIRAATETAIAHGIIPDRCDILQNGHTLVLRLTETLVARVVTEREGPRQGTAWFARENAVAWHLTQRGAPVIPLHPDLPPGPHEHLGYTLNFWLYVTPAGALPEPGEVGRTLFHCHQLLRTLPDPLPKLAILTESLEFLETPAVSGLFPAAALQLLREHLVCSLKVLDPLPHQPLHGDAHSGNLLNTTVGLRWTDWEDAFSGPVEWDLASIIWNARILEEDHDMADGILAAYQNAGGVVNSLALQHCLIARAAVMSAWYPILYPEPDAGRQAKLQRRLDWLKDQPMANRPEKRPR